jgi:defect-in-organelle-trafficking protein DotD
MRTKHCLLFVLFFFVLACTPITYKKPPYNAPSDDATIKLAEAASSVSGSMLEMARVEKVVIPPSADNLQTIPSTQNLLTHASIDWAGPIGELTERLAKAANYKIRVLGHPPPIPVLISLNTKDRALAEILRDIDYQAGKKASIHVYPNNQVVELRYAKTYS